MEGGNGVAGDEEGTVTCAAWIRRPENAHLVVVGKSKPRSSSLEIFSFDPKTSSLSSSPKVYSNAPPFSSMFYSNFTIFFCVFLIFCLWV